MVASDRRDEGGRMDGCFNINSFKIHVSSVFVQFNWLKAFYVHNSKLYIFRLKILCWETAYEDMISKVERNGAKGGFLPDEKAYTHHRVLSAQFFLILTLWGVSMTTVLWHHSTSQFAFAGLVMCCWPVCPSSPNPQPQFPCFIVCFQLVFFSGWTATNTSCLSHPTHGVQLGRWK